MVPICKCEHIFFCFLFFPLFCGRCFDRLYRKLASQILSFISGEKPSLSAAQAALMSFEATYPLVSVFAFGFTFKREDRISSCGDSLLRTINYSHYCAPASRRAQAEAGILNRCKHAALITGGAQSLPPIRLRGTRNGHDVIKVKIGK